MIAVDNVVEEGMRAIYGKDVKDGEYPVEVDSSSSMFNITSCTLKAENGKMTAVMVMGGTGYLKLFMGTGSEAVRAGESEYIPVVENEQGKHTFTVPVEALDKAISCTAFSKSKEKWYDRTLVFRADSMPVSAFDPSLYSTVESLSLKDGEYEAEVTVENTAGKINVLSPARITVKDGRATAHLVWSGSKCGYIVYNGEKLLSVSSGGDPAFDMPVDYFDWRLPISAETSVLGQSKEVRCTVCVDSASLK